MTDLYSTSSSVSPFTAVLWCLYPIAVLVIIELLLGGGFDDDNNDDQDGGMLIPAYSRSNVWNFWIFKLQIKKDFQQIAKQYWYNFYFPNYPYHPYNFISLLAGFKNP